MVVGFNHESMYQMRRSLKSRINGYVTCYSSSLVFTGARADPLRLLGNAGFDLSAGVDFRIDALPFIAAFDCLSAVLDFNFPDAAFCIESLALLGRESSSWNWTRSVSRTLLEVDLTSVGS